MALRLVDFGGCFSLTETDTQAVACEVQTLPYRAPEVSLLRQEWVNSGAGHPGALLAAGSYCHARVPSCTAAIDAPPLLSSMHARHLL